ncbi:uncharacterized protein ACDP82_021043 [Pangshura tecta]
MAALDADSPGAEECLEEDEEELETSVEDPENESAGKPAPGGRSCILTRRGITLRVLLKDGLIEPGEGVLSIYYLVRAECTGLVCLPPRWVPVLPGRLGVPTAPELPVVPTASSVVTETPGPACSQRAEQRWTSPKQLGGAL